jgi:hypothetical protein
VKLTKRWCAALTALSLVLSNACAPSAPRADAAVDAAMDSSASDSGPDAAPSADVLPSDATPSADASLAAACTDTFGTALTNAFGRADGVVLAVLRPTDQQCPRPNSTHVIAEITFGGAAYRMVINIQSTRGNPNVFYLEHRAPLSGPAWSEGWHPGLSFDYATTLSLHSTQFTEVDAPTVTDRVLSRFRAGAKVSFFVTSSGGDSAHLVHRNLPNQDGAIVIDPESAEPTYLLFRFSDQSF